MAKFRKKPVVIEAVQVVGDDGRIARECPDWLRDAIALGTVSARQVHRTRPEEPETFTEWQIKTLEGSMYARPGDWIIRGVKGELYPCKPDIFEQTYEPVPDRGEDAPHG